MPGDLTLDYFRCAIQVLGRIAIPPAKVQEIIGSKKKQVRAFNLCNGSLSLTEISRKARINQGNFSRTVNRWKQNGIIYWVGEGQDARPIHLYPIPETGHGKKGRRKKGRRTR